MFDLTKDLDRYAGIPPYASEHYGIYQPLLGWNSRLTQEWIRKGIHTQDPRIRRILNGRISPGPTRLDDFIAMPLQPGTGKAPWRVSVTKDLQSEFVMLLRDAVQDYVNANDGKLPTGKLWNQIIEINNLMDPDGPMRVVNDRLRQQILDRIHLEYNGSPSKEALEAGEAEHLAAMQYESQIAAALLFYAEGQHEYKPDMLNRLFAVSTAPDLDSLFASTDPLASIDPNDRSGVLSPVGFIHRFRQYFFDLGTFLGEPVEHIWLTPGATTEVIEVSTRRSLIERTEENLLESNEKVERSASVKDELSDAIRSENDSSTKLGVSTTNSVKFGVYQGTATVSVNVDSSRKEARENVHKQSREQAEKLSTEIKRSFKSVFRSVTENTDSRTKRYVLTNPSGKLMNIELRRKMRRVGVQLQDLGTQLCWQVFVDDPGAALGLAELVHYAESPDLASIKEPDPLPYPAPIVTKLTVPIEFRGINTDDNAGALYEWRGLGSDGVNYGNRMNTQDEDEQDKRISMGPFSFNVQIPQSDYVLAEVRPVSTQNGQIGVVRSTQIGTSVGGGSFEIVMNQLQFNNQKQVQLDIEAVFTPTADAFNVYAARKKKAEDAYDAEVYRLVRQSYTDSVRDRINAARATASRPSWDLREEERTVIYRELLRRLMQDQTVINDYSQRRLNHVRSEIVRSLFDVDAMLYFVSPEWWVPRLHQTSHTFNASVTTPDQVVNLSDENQVRWKDTPIRKDNYSITEQSEPAKLGSSLGWLMQHDGDNLRNAFLNSPWVKAVIPIREGRESAALNWLRAMEGHEHDGWDATFIASTPEDEVLLQEVAADGNPPLLGHVLEKIAQKLATANADIATTLASDEVFEGGFNPLDDGFDAGLPARSVFSQWITVLPTDQIVAAEYVPSNALET